MNKMWAKTWGLVALMMTMLVSSAFAQPRRGDDGQYQILQARYGTAERNVDVTERLRELARSDQGIRIGNDAFGVDPDERRVKTLRIYARGPNGQTRTFEYSEGSVLDGAQFSGWRGGEWNQGGGHAGGWGGRGGQYQIEQAIYGTPRRSIDVTDRLRELARSNQNFRLKNELFGTDPAPNRVKTLRIVTRGPRGEGRTFEYTEGSVVEGSQFAGWGGGWGQGGRYEGGGAQGGRPEYGGGPQGGRPEYGGDRPAYGGGRLEIVNAVYGAGNRQRDVTDFLQSLTRDGRLDISVNEGGLGIDPAPGQRKVLVVTFMQGGRQQQVRVDEGGRLTLP
jgi:hypothetical protein